MFNIVDYIILGILVIVAISYLVKGFMKNALNDIFFVAVIVGAIFICPIVVNKLLGIEAIAGFSTTIDGWFSFLNKEGIGQSILKIALYIVSAIVVMLILGIISKIIKRLLRKVINPKSGVLKLIDKLLGFVFGVVFYGIICLGIVGAVGTIKNESIQKTLDNSFCYKNNFLKPYCEEYLNLGKLVDGFTTDKDSDDDNETPDDGNNGGNETPDDGNNGGNETPDDGNNGGNENQGEQDKGGAGNQDDPNGGDNGDLNGDQNGDNQQDPDSGK